MSKFISGTVSVNVLLSFTFGIIFVSTMLVFAVVVPNPSAFSQWVFITVLALSAAGIGSVVPGMLNIDLPYVKAGGAVALFAIVFLMKPAIISSVVRVEPPPGSPDPAIAAYLAKTDNNDMDGAWSILDPEAQSGVARDKDAYRQAYAAGRVPLGKVDSRTQIGVQELQSPSGFPIGVYRIISFRTKFKNGICYGEQVMLRGYTDKIWRVYDHVVLVNPIPCI